MLEINLCGDAAYTYYAVYIYDETYSLDDIYTASVIQWVSTQTGAWKWDSESHETIIIIVMGSLLGSEPTSRQDQVVREYIKEVPSVG
jgi:hypothetical protein